MILIVLLKKVKKKIVFQKHIYLLLIFTKKLKKIKIILDLLKIERITKLFQIKLFLIKRKIKVREIAIQKIARKLFVY